jgi:hypothetical protein
MGTKTRKEREVALQKDLKKILSQIESLLKDHSDILEAHFSPFFFRKREDQKNSGAIIEVRAGKNVYFSFKENLLLSTDTNITEDNLGMLERETARALENIDQVLIFRKKKCAEK